MLKYWTRKFEFPPGLLNEDTFLHASLNFSRNEHPFLNLFIDIYSTLIFKKILQLNPLRDPQALQVLPEGIFLIYLNKRRFQDTDRRRK